VGWSTAQLLITDQIAMTVASQSLSARPDLRRAPHAMGFGFADLLCFLVPSLLAVNVHSTGRVFLSELILVAALPFVLAESLDEPRNAWTVIVVVFGLLWLWAQVVSDVYRSTAFSDMARGWLNVTFTVIDFIVIFILVSGRHRRILYFAAGLAVGYALEYVFNPSPYADVDPWKFGVAVPLTLVMVLLACRPGWLKFTAVSPVLLFSAGLLNFAFGFRSLGGVCLLAAAYVVAQTLYQSRELRAVRLPPARLAVFICVGALLAILVVSAYGHAARDGLLGARAATQYRAQSAGNFGVIIGGRPELLASFAAIADSPLIGHGSYAKNPKYTSIMISRLYSNGYTPDPNVLYEIQHSGYVIPSHSYLFGAWVQAGLLGALFWIVILALVVRALAMTFPIRHALSPLIAFLSALLVWNIFFSPYGADQRILGMFSVAALATFCQLPRTRPQQAREGDISPAQGARAGVRGSQFSRRRRNE
jgi:hypothetical protein